MLAFGIVAVVAAVGAAGAAAGRGLNSDELAWQRLLDVWGHEGHGTTWISEDLFVTRFVLYGLLEAVGIVGRRAAISVSMTLNVVAAWAFVGGLLASGELRKPLRAGTIAALGLAGAWAPIAWYDVFFNPNSRAFELGCSVLGVGLLGRWTARGALGVGTALGLGAGLAIIWVSDPFVLYLVGGTAAVVALLDLAKPVRRRQAGLVLALIGGSAVASLALRRSVQIFDVFTRPVVPGSRRYITAVGEIPGRAVSVIE